MVYLIEYAKSDRSVCKGPKKSCVSDSNHIAKGALRLGVETDIGGNVRLTWRHWLCTTPKVLANMREAMSEPEEIQGFDAIREEDQDRIRQAWADGELPEDEKKDEGEEEGAQGDHEEKEEEEKPESSPKSKDAELPKTADKESDETEKDKEEEETKKENGDDKEEASNGAVKKASTKKSNIEEESNAKEAETPKRKAPAKAKKAEKPKTEPTRRSTRVQAAAATKETTESAKERKPDLKRKNFSSSASKKKSKH